MKERIIKVGRRLFTPPVFAQNEKAQAVSQLYAILWIQILSIIVIGIVLSFLAPDFVRRWLVFTFFTIAISLALLELSRRGRTFLSSIMLVTELWVILTAFAWTAGGIGARAAWGYFIVVFIAGMLLGRTAGIIMAGIGSLSTLAIALLSPVVSPHPLQFWLTNTMYLIFVVFLQFLASRSIRESLDKAKQQLQQRRQAEEAIQIRDRAIATSFNAIVIAALNGKITYVNEAFVRMWGYTAEEALSLNVADLDADKNEILQITEDIKAKGFSIGESVAIRKNRSLFHIQFSASLVSNTAGETIAMLSTFIDISERKQAQDTLQARENMLSSIFRAAPTGIGVVCDRIITLVNKQICEMTGWTQEELIGKSSRLLYPSDADFEFVGKEKYRQIAERGTGTVETRWQCKDGRIINVLLSSTPINPLNQAEGVTFTVLDITDRKQAEAAMLDSNRFISSLLRAIPVAVFFKDKDGKYTGCNDAFTEIMGVTSDEIIGRTVHEIWPSELAETYHQKDLELMKERKHQVYEFKVKDKHGQLRPVIYAKDVFLDANGEIGGLVGAFLDITDRKQAEEKLLESERRYRALFEAADDGILLLHETHFVDCNVKILELFGCTREQIDSVSQNQLSPEKQPNGSNSREKAMEKYRAALSGHPQRFEWIYFRSDGTPFPAEVSLSSVELGSGTHLLVLIRDITERKLAEERLLESERRYRTLFESAGDAIFLLHKNQIIDCNSRTMEMFGCTREQIIGMPISRFHPPHQSDGSDSLMKGREKNKAALSGDSQFFEWRHIRFDGTPFDAEVSLNRVELGLGPHLLAIVRDIADRKMLEEQLRQAQKMEAVGTLAGGVAHDFNNILSTIVGYASLLQMQAGLDKKAKEYLERILTSTERAARLTQSLLAFSRKQDIELQSVDINDSIFGFHKVLARLIGEDIDFKLNLASESLVVAADIRQIEQVLMNLATNARDAMPHGGKLTITTGSVVLEEGSGEIPRGSYVVISVSDTGMGMNSEIQSHVFEPFYTTKEVGKGTGLGLAIAYGIIKNHQGFIKIDSESAHGTTFHIYLPLKPLAIQKGRRKKQVNLPGGNETILLVEDDAAVRHVTKSMLEEFGYTVLEAADGIEALAVFAQHRDQICLLLSDLIMPKKNGKETRAGIMKLKPSIKTIFMSGYTSDIIARKGILDPGIHLLLKPLHPADLLTKVREVLDS